MERLIVPNSNDFLDLDNIHTLGTAPFLGWEEVQIGKLSQLPYEGVRKWVRVIMSLPKNPEADKRIANSFIEAIENEIEIEDSSYSDQLKP